MPIKINKATLILQIWSSIKSEYYRLFLKSLDEWMLESNCEQIDDITILGVKI